MSSLYLVLLTLFLGVYALVAWYGKRAGVFLLLALLPTYLLRLDIGGIPTTLLELMLGIAILAWLFKHRKQGVDWTFLKGWKIPIGIVLVAATVGVFVAPDLLDAIGIWKAYFVEPILFFLLLRTTFKHFDDAEQALMALGTGALFVGGFAIFQHLTGIGIPIPWDVEGRVTSIFPYPNAVGLFLGPIIVLGIGALFRSLKAAFYPRAWFWFIVIGCSMTAVFFSQTEAAWIAIPASLLLAAWFIPRLQLLAVPLTLLAIGAVLLIPAARTKI
ncbi:MAG: hypothetical protein Q8P12_04380, partial [bacterium]|nr:hypothetical protein [bacterium]